MDIVESKLPEQPQLKEILPPCSTLLTLNSNIHQIDDHIVYDSIEKTQITRELDEEEEMLVLDLDNNTIITNNVVMNVEYSNPDFKEIIGSLEPKDTIVDTVMKEESYTQLEEEENLILDLDNNTIISSNPNSSMNFVVNSEPMHVPDILIIDSPPRPSTSTKSKIVITKINKPTS